MENLQQFVARDQNHDPNTQIMRQVDPITGVARLEHVAVGNNFETQSIKSNISYKWSAIGEMNNDELDQLKAKNAERMREIEAQYFVANESIKTAKEIMREQ